MGKAPKFNEFMCPTPSSDGCMVCDKMQCQLSLTLTAMVIIGSVTILNFHVYF